MTPEAAMDLALRQARHALGRCFPNPPVGAVVWRGDRVLGRGYTRPAGSEHAEVVALRRALRVHGRSLVRRASLAVTLEPCCHRGRTAPCSEAVLEAGIRRVFVGHRDPDPRVAGRGLRILRRAGVQVEVGVREAECRHQHRGFLSVHERGRPWVSLKLAVSLDGRIATAQGESRWITGERARALVHRLRDRVDAVMVGSGTALRDDPELTVRRGPRTLRCPVRVVVDGRLRLTPEARLLRGADARRTWLLVGPDPPRRRSLAVQDQGARLLAVPLRAGHVDLRRALVRLAREGLTHVLVEGGAGLATELLRGGLVDELHWFVAPSLLGGDARAALGSLGIRRLADRLCLETPRVRRLGQDLYLHGMLSSAAAGSASGSRHR